ncbi:MAG: ATP-binding protein [Candidatus Altiarchaeota archaeon]|nr:ATP-binding protein [Candidatus Altiarchaeota archaeon]
MYLDDIADSRDVVIPKNPIERVVGQERAVEKVKIAIMQRRHLLFVGPPGIGKSMIAQALALNLPKPNEEVRVLHNVNDPERPILEVVRKEGMEKAGGSGGPSGVIVSPKEVPVFVAEQLGFRCSSCGALSGDRDMICPGCGVNKYVTRSFGDSSPFSDIITEVFEMGLSRPEREVQTTKIDKDGRESILVYRKIEGGRIQVLDKSTMNAPGKAEKKRKVLVPLRRIPFVQATGASETELLGDVRHDPFGSHPEIGTPAYMRVIPGAVHEAHEGVLFIDELPHIKHLQSFILTAMQEKRFPIVGRNPHSAGAAVKLNNVPCDFIFVGACNIGDVGGILPPLRSRILGSGYEILLETTMPDTDANRSRMALFVAQEIETDKRIPPASKEAIEEIVKEARARAASVDKAKNALSLRLRDLGGLIRYAGDLAILDGSTVIEREHIRKAAIEAKPVEFQIRESYGSLWKGLGKDAGLGLDDEGSEEGYR